MKFKIPKLHNQILIALVAGAVFGSIFNVSRTALIISYKENKQIKTLDIQDWKRFSIVEEGLISDSISFKAHQQIEIINYFKRVKNGDKTISVILEKY